MYPTKVLTLPNHVAGTQLVVKPQLTPLDRHQLWTVRNDGAIVNAATGWLVDVFGAGQNPGTPAIVWPEQSPAAANQRWYSNERIITSQLHNQVLDVDARDKESIILYPNNRGANQSWIFNPINSSSCAGSRTIWDVTVISGGNSGISCPAGYEKNGQDLNEGAGGNFIYLCIDRNNVSRNTTPIRQLETVASVIPLNSGACSQGFTLVDNDLNKDAGGYYISFCYSRNVNGNSWILSDVQFVTSNTSRDAGALCAVTLNTDYRAIGYGEDLNRGAGGKYIYGCQKHHA